MWQVEVGGQIYEAALGELPEWIGEGSLQPGDKVRKGNLRWIEARKVPMLVPFFNAKEKGDPLPIIQTYTEANPGPSIQSEAIPISDHVNHVEPFHAAPNSQTSPAKSSFSTSSLSTGIDFCSIHVESPAYYFCVSCDGKFCKACPKSFGGDVKICPNCDSLCKPIGQAAEANRRTSIAAGTAYEGFGISDFFRALAHPLKFKPSLIFGAVMFMFFSLGQSASAIGGVFMIAASIFCAMLANMLTFGILANTVQNFIQGRLDADFMPSFDDFSIWDDVLHPFFLSIGVYISSFGPFVLVVVVGFYLVFSAASEQMKKFNSEIARVPGTPYYQPDRTMEQSQQVKDLLEKVKQHNDRQIAQRQQQVEAADSAAASNLPDPVVTSNDEREEFERMLQETRTAQVEPVAGTQMLSGIMRLAAPLVVIGIIALLWGLFYFPAACAVAGYSRSFMATINPMVGIDTIKRLGSSYVKILLMSLCILIMSVVVSGFLALLFSPFNLPKLGNLPVIAIGSLFTFYFSVVFSCIIGLALFKAADRLKLYR